MSKEAPLKGLIEEFSKLTGEMNDLIEKCRIRLEEIKIGIRTTSDLGELGEAREELRLIRTRLIKKRVEVTNSLKRKLRELERRIRMREVGFTPEQYDELEEFVEKELESIEERVDALLDQIDILRDEIEERMEALREGRAAGPRVARVFRTEVSDIGRVIEEALSSDLGRGPTLVVSSVRLLKADVDLIDALVEAGIFRSRNEGIAFFVHKGIKGSKDWLLRIKERLEEIRRLQEEAKRELRRALGEVLEETRGERS